MIRNINLSGLFCRSFYAHKKCRIVANSLSTSAIVQVERKGENFLDLKKKYIKTYEDTFGDIENFEAKFQRIKDDPEDILEYERLKAAPGKTTQEYITEVKSLLAKNDYKAAIKLLEVDMRNDRIYRTEFVYRVLISYNGLLGDVEEAYRLFIKYKESGGIPTASMYTSLFNACANCKNSLLALEKAGALREALSKDKCNIINSTHYNVMLKAFGRHSDLPTCFKIIDEVLERREKVKNETYSFLLQACISDPNSGLRHALLVWREMLQNKTKPNIFTFNLMLRCIRDCLMGEVLLIPDAIKEILNKSKYFYKRKIKIIKDNSGEKRTILKIPSDGSDLIKPVKAESKPEEQSKKDIPQMGDTELKFVEQKAETSQSLIVENQEGNHLSNLKNEVDEVDNCLSVKENEISPAQNDFKLPNLLALKPTIGSVIDFSKMTSPQDRFLLVGGVDGFLKTMEEFGVQPDLKTFTLMLNLIPLTVEAEEKLISLIETYKVKIDTGFFNVLLSRRVTRNEDHLIKDCLDQMYKRGLKPDLITFEILAENCQTHELGTELLENLHKHGLRMSSTIISTLLKKAKKARDMKYVLTILRAAKEDGAEMRARHVTVLSHIVEQEKRRKLCEKNSYHKDNIENAESSPSRV